MNKLKEKLTIPKGWVKKPVLELCDFERGFEPGSKNYLADKNTGVRFLRVVDMTGSREGETYINKSENQYAKIGDVLVTLDGSLGVVRNDLEGHYSSGIRRVTFKNKEFPSVFLFQLLRGRSFQEGLITHAKGTIIKHGGGALQYIDVLIPCEPAEQKKIAEILGIADEELKKTKEVIKATEEMKKGLMQQLFTRGIGHTKFKQTGIGTIPEKWDVQLLDTVAKRGSGHTPSKKVEEYYNGGIRWVSLADSNKLDKREISETKIEISQKGIENSSAYIHPKGTVLMSRDAGIGKSAVMAENMAVSQHFITWTCGESLNNWYLYYFLQSQKSEFERIAMGSTIKTIGVGYFQKLKVPLPQLSEQEEIAEILSAVDEKIAVNKKLLAKQTELKKGLMQDLLSGTKRVTI